MNQMMEVPYMSFLGPNFKKMKKERDIDELIRIYANDRPKNKIKAGEVLVQLMDPVLAKNIVNSNKLEIIVRAHEYQTYDDETDPLLAIVENGEAEAVV